MHPNSGAQSYKQTCRDTGAGGGGGGGVRGLHGPHNPPVSKYHCFVWFSISVLHSLSCEVASKSSSTDTGFQS